MKIIKKIKFYFNLKKNLNEIEKYELERLKNDFLLSTENLIVFLLPSNDSVGGGILSISSLFDESKKLELIHHAKVLSSKYPHDLNNLFFNKYTNFENDLYLYRFENIIKFFPKLKSVTVHIPEYYVSEFFKKYKKLWSKDEKKWLENIPVSHLNIMNQNIQLMPKKKYIDGVKEIFTKVTQTTAHDKYADLKTQNEFGVQLHHFSTFVDEKDYAYKNFNEKKKIIMLSPDKNCARESITAELQEKMPDYEIRIVKNLSYEDYKKLASDCRFSITFGEGLDGYFIEPVWSGGVSFAVYNEDFFMPEYKNLKTVYSSYDEMLENICGDIKTFENEPYYNEYNKNVREILNKYYSFEKYQENIKQFYLGNYSLAK